MFSQHTRSIAGGWCTCARLHTEYQWPCIFGCPDARDEICHYLICPILWQFPREFMSSAESSLSIDSRLGLVEPSVHKLRAFVFVHCLYHACRNCAAVSPSEGMLNPPGMVQAAATNLCRYIRHLVG